MGMLSKAGEVSTKSDLKARKEKHALDSSMKRVQGWGWNKCKHQMWWLKRCLQGKRKIWELFMDRVISNIESYAQLMLSKFYCESQNQLFAIKLK